MESRTRDVGLWTHPKVLNAPSRESKDNSKGLDTAHLRIRVPKAIPWYGLWNQNPQMGSIWKLWELFRYIR